MSQRRNYGFERRKKALDRQAKQEAKRQRKAQRTESGVSGPEIGEAQHFAAPPGTWEWFSPSRSSTLAAPRGTRPDLGPPDDWVLLTELGEEAPPGGQPGEHAEGGR